MTIHQDGDLLALPAVAIGVRVPFTGDHNQRVIHTKSSNPCRTTPTRRTKFARRGTWCLRHFLLEVVEAVVFLRRRTRSAHLVFASVPVLVCLLAACSGSTSGSSSSPAPSTPSPTVVTPTPTASSPTAAAALVSYRAFWDAQIRSQRDPAHSQDPNLARYASASALAGAQSTLLVFRQNGIAMRGEPLLAPTVEAVNTAGGTVSIRDCVDSTHWTPVYVATGKSAAAPNQAPRVVVTAEVMLLHNRWTVTATDVHRDQTC